MPNETILVVDDEPDVLDVIVRTLRRTKRFNVLKACGYEEAFQEIAVYPQPIDLAILDIALQGKNGVDLATDMQVLYPDVKVLFVSGLAGAELLKYSAGSPSAEPFLAKPFKPAQLRRRVEEMLSHTSLKTLTAGSTPV